jgi:integrase
MLERYKHEVLTRKPKSAACQLTQLKWWSAQLGDVKLADVTPAAVSACRERLLAERTKRGKLRSPSTVVRYLAVLSHAFSVALREWDWVSDNPLRKVSKPKEPRGRVRFLDDGERDRLLHACRASDNALLYPIVVLAIATGMRRGELMHLSWRQIDFTRNTITLHETKNGERHAVPLVGLARELIHQLHLTRRSDTDLIFPSAKFAKPVDITRAWRTAVAKADLLDFRFHDLRHTTASYLAQGGATPIEIAAVLNHKTLAMVKRYAHLGESPVRQALVDMNERIFSPRT